MSDEHDILQNTMQFLPTRLAIVVLKSVEEQFPASRKIMVSAVCLCADRRILPSYSQDCMAQRAKCFLGILCYLSFSVV